MTSAARALIFNVQRFCVHDGPGIRTTVFFKGCPLRCSWCQNPESIRAVPELALYRERCQHALACVAACPHGAAQGAGGDLERDRCQACGSCVPACPHGARELVGRLVAVPELMAEVVRDRAFFAASGGGVTLSGGEPTAQLDFVRAFAAACVEQQVPVCLQTCGAFRWDRFAPYLSLFQLIYYDLKLMDPRRHREHAGTDNRLILDNARRLVEAVAPVTFRFPVVPGITDGADNVAALGGFLHELGVGELTLLPYHRMGEAKASRIAHPCTPPSSDHSTVERSLARVVKHLEERGIITQATDG